MLKDQYRGQYRAQQVKAPVPAAKPDNSSLISRIHSMERTDSCKLFSVFYICTCVSLNKKINVWKGILHAFPSIDVLVSSAISPANKCRIICWRHKPCAPHCPDWQLSDRQTVKWDCLRSSNHLLICQPNKDAYGNSVKIGWAGLHRHCSVQS